MRLIDADALLKAIIQMSLDGNVFDRIREAPTIEPQRTGRWMPTEPDEPCFYRCSECGRLIDERENFCPNCGADMRTPVEIARDIVHEAIDNSVWSDTVDTAKMHKIVDDKYAEMEGQDDSI